MKKQIILEYEIFPDISEVDPSQAVCMSIVDMKGMVETGTTIGEAMYELALSVCVKEAYDTNSPHPLLEKINKKGWANNLTNEELVNEFRKRLNLPPMTKEGEGKQNG